LIKLGAVVGLVEKLNQLSQPNQPLNQTKDLPSLRKMAAKDQ